MPASGVAERTYGERSHRHQTYKWSTLIIEPLNPGNFRVWVNKHAFGRYRSDGEMLGQTDH